VETVRVVRRKWPDLPHWESDAVRLGEDAHGTWLGQPPGTLMTRPGASFRTDWSQVTLVPVEQPFVATFYTASSSAPVEVYVDIATTSVWDSGAVICVDLDLDVMRGWTGRVWVDDEDEFAEHRVRYGYPDEVVRLATRTCEEVRRAVESRHPPYDGLAPSHWLGRLDALMMDR
jgi:hypothetical protein